MANHLRTKHAPVIGQAGMVNAGLDHENFIGENWFLNRIWQNREIIQI
jgi:hypothetical protein